MKALPASATLTINGIAKKKRLNGERVFNFAAGDPAIKNHPYIIKKAIEQTEKGYCPYPPVEGLPELRRLAAEWMNKNCQTNYSAENVLVTCGGKFAIFTFIYALLEPRQEVLIPAPYWVSYPAIVTLAGGVPKPVVASYKNSWKITPEELAAHITPNTKMLIFNNACNPTGALYTRQEVENILNFAKKHDLIVISDEVYSGLVYEPPGFTSCGAFPEHKERVHIIQSCSKNFGMPGWRVGFAFSPENEIKNLIALQGQTTTGTSLVSQQAAIGALGNASEVNAYVKESMRKKRDLFIATFNALFPVPLPNIPATLYAFVPLSSMGVPSGLDSTHFCEKIIASHNVALVPGIAFGVEGHVRFAFSESEKDIKQGLEALKLAISIL